MQKYFVDCVDDTIVGYEFVSNNVGLINFYSWKSINKRLNLIQKQYFKKQYLEIKII